MKGWSPERHGTAWTEPDCTRFLLKQVRSTFLPWAAERLAFSMVMNVLPVPAAPRNNLRRSSSVSSRIRYCSSVNTISACLWKATILSSSEAKIRHRGASTLSNSSRTADATSWLARKTPPHNRSRLPSRSSRCAPVQILSLNTFAGNWPLMRLDSLDSGKQRAKRYLPGKSAFFAASLYKRIN